MQDRSKAIKDKKCLSLHRMPWQIIYIISDAVEQSPKEPMGCDAADSTHTEPAVYASNTSKQRFWIVGIWTCVRVHDV